MKNKKIKKLVKIILENGLLVKLAKEYKQGMINKKDIKEIDREIKLRKIEGNKALNKLQLLTDEDYMVKLIKQEPLLKSAIENI